VRHDDGEIRKRCGAFAQRLCPGGQHVSDQPGHEPVGRTTDRSSPADFVVNLDNLALVRDRRNVFQA
jgi:hypothetical protein